METPSILELSIRDFRAIKNATIKLDGITVVTGENSSGKSTISQLLYYLFKIVDNYDNIIYEKLSDVVKEIMRILSDIGYEDDRSQEDELFHQLHAIREDIPNRKEQLITLIDDMKTHSLKNEKKERNQHNSRINRRKHRIYRLYRLLQDDFSEYADFFTDEEDLDSEKILDTIKKILEKLYEDTEKDIQTRSKKIFEKKLTSVFRTKIQDFTVSEYGDTIISSKNETLGRFGSISEVIYVDSPMAVEHPKYIGYWRDRNIKIAAFSHWQDLDFYLKRQNIKHIEEIRDTSTYSELQKIFTFKEVLNGEIRLDESRDELMFYRNDGMIFRVADCATGIKSIAVLQTLYNNGWLTSKTLLVLDEPEAHLHPQWVVEYARLIVLLNKHIGVKFFIASHNPDMVSAIQDITDKEKLNDNLRFYLAEKTENYTYEFKDKNTDVEDIFASFNIAIDRIHMYGGDSE